MTSAMTQPLAMHLGDGLLDGHTSALFGVLAIVAVGFAALRVRGELDDRIAPLAGLVAAFVFAAQMINFPILPGVSGHLIGGALAAILLGPWAGALCLSIVLTVQAVVFADGGLTALGANVVNMAVIGTAVGYLAALALTRVSGRSPSALALSAFVAGWLSTVAASLGFLGEYLIGGQAAVPMGELTLSVVGVHALIGIGDGIITALAVTVVATTRPDLIYPRRPVAATRELTHA